MFFYFFVADCQKRRAQFFYGRGVVTSIETLLFNYDNLTLKLQQKKRSDLDEKWLFIGKFKVGGVPGISVDLAASKNKSIKIHEFDARPLIKSHNSY